MNKLRPAYDRRCSLFPLPGPWAQCKNLKPAWIDSATQLKGKVKVAAVDW